MYIVFVCIGVCRVYMYSVYGSRSVVYICLLYSAYECLFIYCILCVCVPVYVVCIIPCYMRVLAYTVLYHNSIYYAFSYACVRKICLLLCTQYMLYYLIITSTMPWYLCVYLYLQYTYMPTPWSPCISHLYAYTFTVYTWPKQNLTICTMLYALYYPYTMYAYIRALCTTLTYH